MWKCEYCFSSSCLYKLKCVCVRAYVCMDQIISAVYRCLCSCRPKPLGAAAASRAPCLRTLTPNTMSSSRKNNVQAPRTSSNPQRAASSGELLTKRTREESFLEQGALSFFNAFSLFQLFYVMSSISYFMTQIHTDTQTHSRTVCVKGA